MGFEVRLPMGNWNGKLFMQGCRAYCGVIMIDEANDALKRGYVTVATDMGHRLWRSLMNGLSGQAGQ